VRRGEAVAVVLQLAVGQRARVHPVVADAGLVVAGDVRAEHDRVDALAEEIANSWK
jgi:hypothetical protein